MKKRLLALLLAMAVLFAMPAAFAEDDEDWDDEDWGDDEFEEFDDGAESEEEEVDFRNIAGYPQSSQKINCGDFSYLPNADGTASLCGYIGTGVDVVIPETLDDRPVVVIMNNAFAYNPTIETLVMPTTLKYIDTMAFTQCAKLRKAILNEGLLTIGDCAFGGDVMLSEINFPDSVRKIGTAAFAACVSLTEVTFGPELESTGLQAFHSCAGLKKVTFGAGIKAVDNESFFKCVGLEEIDLDPAVETIGARAFASCAALKTVRVPAGAETDESAFADCSADLQIITE